MKRLVPHLAGVFALVWVGLLAFPSEVVAQGTNARLRALESQMAAVQKTLATHTSQISALTSENGNRAAEIAALQAENATQAGLLALLGTGVTGLMTENATQAAQIAALQAGVVPVGTIITYSSETPPPGYLECDGTQLSRTAYPQLFGVIGTAWGAGDGSSTFHIPDLRGRFLRGWAHGNSLDPDRDSRGTWYVGGAFGDHVGSFQNFAVQAHNHIVGTWGAIGPGGPVDVMAGNAIAFFGNRVTTFAGGNETRPYNVSVMYAIKH